VAIEIISTVTRRRRWTPQEKVAILEEAFGAGSSVAATSDRHGVSRALIYLWRRQARMGLIPGVGMAEPAAPAFAPVRLVTSNRDRDGPSAPEPSPAKAQRPGDGIGNGRIEIALRNGRSIKADDGIDPAILARLVAALHRGGP
jgi:transposase